MNVDTIDWNDIWKRQMALHDEVEGSSKGEDIWGTIESARKFWERVRRDSERINRTLDELDLHPDSKVLDIGAGPGSLSIPLSKRVAHITAVEPSNGMISVLHENIRERGIENITTVHKSWEDLDIAELDGPYDVIIASYSLHVPDIKKAIEKIQAVSEGSVYIFWFAGETSWDRYYGDIWPALHNEDYCPSPKCDVLYNVLYNMGIYPNVSVFPLGHDSVFSSVDEAIEHYRPHYRIKTPGQEDILREYFKKVLLQEDDSVVQKGDTMRVKMWWKNEVE